MNEYHQGLRIPRQMATSAAMSRPATALLIGLLGFIAYVILVLVVGDWVLKMHGAVQFFYFAIAGIAWVFPAKRLIYWSAGK